MKFLAESSSYAPYVNRSEEIINRYRDYNLIRNIIVNVINRTLIVSAAGLFIIKPYIHVQQHTLRTHVLDITIEVEITP